MGRLVSLGPANRNAANASFAEPFEMLHACHERVHRTLGLLQRLRTHLRREGADEQARQAARDVMRYFDQAAPQHHLDEELHVFPALLAQCDTACADVVARLQRDHRQMTTAWGQARTVLQSVAAGHSRLGAQEEEALDHFAALYEGHIEAEETLVYPAAARIMGDSQRGAMGREMGARRGLHPGAGERTTASA